MMQSMGTRNWYGLTQILSTIVFAACCFVTSSFPTNPSTYVALTLMGLAGINFATFNSVPFALLSNYVKVSGFGGFVLCLHKLRILIIFFIVSFIERRCRCYDGCP